MTFQPIASSCLACGFHWSSSFFDGGEQPLATLGWPESAEISLQMKRLPLKFVRCLNCGHIYNHAFEYQNVPYLKHPNLMYNQSASWQTHLQDLCDYLSKQLPSAPTILEIGCGNGRFLQNLAARFQSGRFIGFDPNGSFEDTLDPKVELHASLFEAASHLQRYQPDLILSRHVLEHLMNPLAFLQEMVLWSSREALSPLLFFEVPCVDRILEYGRVEDLYYEHNSHFTQHSFKTMLSGLNCHVVDIQTRYNAEVICGLVKVLPNSKANLHQQETESFQIKQTQAQLNIQQQLEDLCRKQAVVLWGGTGKAAAFVHHFKLNQTQHPLHVVDSDASKVGSYVPGTAYVIHSPTSLLSLKAPVILLPAQWRAADIAQELRERALRYSSLLIEHNGQLIDFHTEIHPYHLSK